MLPTPPPSCVLDSLSLTDPQFTRELESSLWAIHLTASSCSYAIPHFQATHKDSFHMHRLLYDMLSGRMYNDCFAYYRFDGVYSGSNSSFGILHIIYQMYFPPVVQNSRQDS